MTFRSAMPNEADALTQLTLASKRHWGYPEEWMTLWLDDLTITAEYIEKNMVTVAEEGAELLGYVSIKKEDGDFYLDNLFIHPAHIRKGVGEKLLGLALDWCRERQIAQLHVYSDPYSKGFYEKTGAVYVREIPSESIPGRSLPFLTYNIE